jgi:hypothetical protein
VEAVNENDVLALAVIAWAVVKLAGLSFRHQQAKRRDTAKGAGS